MVSGRGYNSQFKRCKEMCIVAFCVKIMEIVGVEFVKGLLFLECANCCGTSQ